MGVVEQIKDTVEKITNDENLIKEFKEDPVKAVEKVIGKDLPDDVVNKVIDGVKAKINLDKVGGVLDKLDDKTGGLGDALKKLF
jgi:hypothetical protein